MNSGTGVPQTVMVGAMFTAGSEYHELFAVYSYRLESSMFRPDTG